ncbi:unnamed protein product [Tuber aestivum]|uniref:Uncharacterized protein n=1 Tax=Tuber aestivum TaxID=59557 RepID=A0A292PYB2_9PEZI|nr:unnamed protein product [Tuber aestivum]
MVEEVRGSRVGSEHLAWSWLALLFRCRNSIPSLAPSTTDIPVIIVSGGGGPIGAVEIVFRFLLTHYSESCRVRLGCLWSSINTTNQSPSTSPYISSPQHHPHRHLRRGWEKTTDICNKFP